MSADLKASRFDADRAALYMLVAPFDRRSDACRPYRAIRTRTHTYVRDLNGPWLLFVDTGDPYQMENLTGRPEQAGVQRELDARLQAELKKTGDDFRPAEHYIDLWNYEIASHGSISYAPGARTQSPAKR